jgi:hypothetical protein
MSTPTLNEREMRIMACAWQCLKSPPEVSLIILLDVTSMVSCLKLDLDINLLQIDYAKFAKLAGYASEGSARNAYLPVKKKIYSTMDDGTGAPVTPKKPRKNKPKTAETDVDGDEETPKPATRKRKTAAEGADGAAPKKRGRKPKSEANIKAEEDLDEEGECFCVLETKELH